ncbi:hypothetical protein [Ahrensia sp. R2A130]|uniref:hypothetical protein n=1 Tax=Ahrensia sp. R2A130 TaxID=744979 RepID=UPI0001E0C9BF|nr:hypothetical protein [Ahrensia sp. R2A130]EFL90832.1 conserved hypothetical protein [Ahrensia sp. R2A130]
MRLGRNGTDAENDPRIEVQAELARREKLVWADRPRRLRSHVMATLPIFLFGIPFFAFAVFWTAAAAGFDTPSSSDPFSMIFPLFGVPFILVGLGLLSSPIWALHKARKTIYGLTEDRAIVITHGFSRSVKSYNIADISRLERIMHGDQFGDLVFGEERRRGKKGRTITTKIGFYGIYDPKRLEETMRDLMRDET